MTERKNQEIAAFRFGVIHEFVTGARLSTEEKRRLLRQKCERKRHIPYSHRSRVSANTIYRWIRRYRDGGGKIQALYPRERNDSGKTRKLDNETICAIIDARKQRPDQPVPMLLEDLKKRLLVPSSVGLTTIYRLLHRNGLLLRIMLSVLFRLRDEIAGFGVLTIPWFLIQNLQHTPSYLSSMLAV